MKFPCEKNVSFFSIFGKIAKFLVLSWKNTLRLYNEDLFEIVDKLPEARLPVPLTIFIPEDNSTVEVRLKKILILKTLIQMTPEMALNQIAPGYVHLSPNRNKITTLGNSSVIRFKSFYTSKCTF